MMSNLH